MKTLRLSRWIKITIVFLLIAVLFHNCAFTGFSAKSLKSLGLKDTTEGNGGPYGGKLEYYLRYIPDFFCEGAQSPLASIHISDDGIHLVKNDPFQCQLQKSDLKLSDLDMSPFQSNILGYEEGIFEGFQVQPNDTPASLVEVWCQSSKIPSDMEVIVHYNQPSNSGKARILFSNSAAPNTPRIIPDFDISRLIEDHKATIQAPGLSLEVDRDAPFSDRAGEFVGKFSAIIDQEMVTTDLRCRLGGELDPRQWPVRLLSVQSAGHVQSSKVTQEPRLFSFYSTNVTADGVVQSADNQGHFYIFSEAENTPFRIDFPGPTDNSSNYVGFSGYALSADGHWIYYRSDQENPHFFSLFQYDLLNKTFRKLPGLPIFGAGPNSTLEGGFKSFSDGTLVYLSDQNQLSYLPPNDPTGTPIVINKNALILAQSFGFVYSTSQHQIIYRTNKPNGISQGYDLWTRNIMTGEDVLLPGGSQPPSTTGDLYTEVKDFFVFYKPILDSNGLVLWPIQYECFTFHIPSGKILSCGQNRTTTISDGLASAIAKNIVQTTMDATGTHTLVLSTTSKWVQDGLSVFDLPETFNKDIYTFSKDDSVLWWAEAGSIRQMNATGEIQTAMTISPDTSVLRILPYLNSKAIAMVYRKDLGIMQIYSLPSVSGEETSLLNHLPLVLDESYLIPSQWLGIIFKSPVLAAEISPSQQVLVFTANTGTDSSSFNAYSVPLDGSLPVAITPLGLKRAFSSEIYFSHDSSRLFFTTLPLKPGSISVDPYSQIFTWKLPVKN